MIYPIWLNDAAEKVTCVEKIKVMEEGLDELKSIASDLLGDAVVMGISELQVRQVLAQMMMSIEYKI